MNNILAIFNDKTELYASKEEVIAHFGITSYELQTCLDKGVDWNGIYFDYKA